MTVEVMNTRTGKKEKIDLRNEELEEVFGAGEEDINDEQLDTINMMLYIKDWYNISDSAYNEMAKVCKEMPRHYRLKRRIQELNKLWNIFPTPNGIPGVQQSLRDRLQVRVQELVAKSSPDAEFVQRRRLRVKLSGDGTNIGKRLHVINFTFTLLDEGSGTSSSGNHILAVFKAPESYESLKLALEDIRKEVEDLHSIEVDGVSYEIEFFLGGDWKFLALVTGIDSACSTYSCIWCKCRADERHDPDKEWSIQHLTMGARTIDENVLLSKRPRSHKRFNVSNAPLFPTIPLTNVVIDNLHLFLRVSDVLLDLLLVELRRQDAIEKVKKFTGKFDIAKYKHIHGFENFVSGL